MNHSDTETPRAVEIRNRYFELLDKHLSDLIDERTERMLELCDIADLLYVSQKHLIKIIQKLEGNHPCHFYVQKIVKKTTELLADTDWPIVEIARRFTYDPSNFTKFFKKHTGYTPSFYRNNLKKAKSSP